MTDLELRYWRWRLNRPQRLGRTARRRWRRWYVTYLRTLGWRRRRAVAIARAHGRCEQCGREQWGQWPDVAQVHHLTYRNLGRERLSDLRVLCLSCHAKQHPRP